MDYDAKLDVTSNQNTQNKDSDSLFKLLELLKKADIKNNLADLNETTMSDNNGGRIEL